MLSIRMQRLGRKGHPVYRIVVQDSRQAPTSGKYVALLGNYDPHTKTANVDKDQAEKYLKNGAQPSDRIVKLFTEEKIKLPNWVKKPTKQERATRNPDKLRKNRPAESAPTEQASAESTSDAEVKSEETPEVAEAPVEKKPIEEKSDTAEAEAPADTEAAKEPAEETSDEKEAETEKA